MLLTKAKTKGQAAPQALHASGQASLVMVLLIGLVAITSALASGALSVSNVRIEETIHSADSAWYAAWAGVDELMYRLRARQDFGSSYEVNLTLAGGATVSATITGDNNQKTVSSRGFFQGIIKQLEVKVAASSSKASFIFAVQSGVGGFELEGQTSVSGTNNTSGNVYSNGAILGIRASNGQSGSKILGSAWAVSNIGGLNSPDTGGVYIQKNAWANGMTACSIGGDAKAPQPPSNCPYLGSFTINPPPPLIPLAIVDIEYWKNQAQAGGTWNGDCTVLATDGTDCTNGMANLGGRKILGNLFVPSGTNFTLTGPVWVKGDINISQNNIIYTDESAGKNSVVLVGSDPDNPTVKGRIITSSNVSFTRNSFGAGIIAVSQNTGDDCAAVPAINITSNTATVVFVAIDGCINISSNSVISGILAKKIHVKNNSSVLYDPSLARAIVDPGSGGWAVVSVREY